jgi:putative nucleotidyltransferase with HDIG domain
MTSTLKKIAVDSVRLGMHIHALEGNWLDHPFWKTKFVLQDPADLQKLQKSGIRECWIDTAKGLDVALPVAEDAVSAAVPDRPQTIPPAAPAFAPTPAASPRIEPVKASSALPAPTRNLREEVEEAAAICRKGKTAIISMFNEARLGKALKTEDCLPLVEEIASSVFRNPEALVNLARLKTKDDYTYMHSVAVAALMVALGRQLGLDLATCRLAGLAGLLHDVGKSLVPLEVLNKPGSLTAEEWTVMRSHPVRGHALIVEAQGSPAEVADVCLHHHERMDGKGYPYGLSGDQLTTLARMGAICDVYDAITSNRPYKAGWDPAESVARMASWAGHFDTTIFGAFVKSLGIYPTGSVVRLESQKVAVVVEQSPTALTAPKVRAFYSMRSRMPITPVLIDLAGPGCADRIVAKEPSGDWSADLVNGLWLPPELAQGTR